MNDQQPLQPNIQPETPQQSVKLPVWVIVLIAVLSAAVIGLGSYAVYQYFADEGTPEPVVCAGEYVPVCGVDGETYSNTCFAELAGVEIDYQGECQDGTKPVACPEDAKVCPDGSSVGRILPNCEFAPCPEVANPITEKAMGYIKTVYERNGKRYLDIDYVQWLTGDEAIKAMREDGKCSVDIYPDSTYCIPNGFYIQNQNPKIRTFKISKNAEITRVTAFDFSPSGKKVITYEEFKNLFTAEDSYFRNIPFHIEVVDDFVVKITERYIP